MSKIARTMGRSNKAVMRVLADIKLSREEWLTRMKTIARERDERIRCAFLEGKSTHQIARELHVGVETVLKAVRGPGYHKAPQTIHHPEKTPRF